MHEQIRRYIARLCGESQNKLDLIKPERLFAKAEKVANKQIAKTQKSPADGSGVQRSLPVGTRDNQIDISPEERYNCYGWTTENDILTATEYNIFEKQFKLAMLAGDQYRKTASGDYMITTGQPYSFKDEKGRTRPDQHYNKIVFVSGTVDVPIISRIVEVDYNIVDNVSDYIEGVIENEQYGIDFIAFAESFEDEKVFSIYESRDFPSFAKTQQLRASQKNKVASYGDTNSGSQQQRGGSTQSYTPSPGVILTHRDQRYFSALQNGDMEAAQRMVEESAEDAGFELLMYHGSKKGGGFTTFRDWSYFTENKEYAERYAERDNPESMYTCFVKMENPFDTREDAAARIFERKIRPEYGTSEIQPSGLPDRTDGHDIAAYIDEKGLDYDTIVLDEGGDLVDGKPVSRGKSYVIRKSAQIKSADPVTYDDNGNVIPLSQRFDSGKSDIRYFLPMQQAENAPNTTAEQAAKTPADTQAPRKIVSDPMSEQGYAEEAARAAVSGVDFENMSPKPPKMSPSLYIKKTLADPTVPEATKKYIREQKNLWPVLTNAEMNARAMDVLSSEDGLASIIDKVGRAPVLSNPFGLFCAKQNAHRMV